MNYSRRIAQELAEVEKNYGLRVEDPLALLTAALCCHGFLVQEVGDFLSSNKKPWQTSRAIGPFAWIWSPEGKEWGDQVWNPAAKEPHDTYRDKASIANLQGRVRLLDLLGEFYSRRSVPIYVRLIVSDMALGSGILKSQGADIMGLPENEPQKEAWLAQARREMTDFTTFLVGKLD